MSRGKYTNMKKTFRTLREEIANVAGSGEIAGLGVTPPDKPANWGEPGVSRKKQKELQRKPSVLRRTPPLNEEFRNQMNEGHKLPKDYHFQDVISDYGRPPDRSYPAKGDGTHHIHVWERIHPNIKGAKFRTTVWIDRGSGLVNAHVQSIVRPSSEPDEELHSDLVTLGREGGPKGIVGSAYRDIMNGKTGNHEGHKYGVLIHGEVRRDPNSMNVMLVPGSRSEGAAKMSSRLAREHKGVVRSIVHPQSPDKAREYGTGGHVASREMLHDKNRKRMAGLVDYLSDQIPITHIDPEYRDPLPDKK